MTVTQAVTKLLRYFSPEERSIPDSVAYPGRNQECLDALNASLQEIFALGPDWIKNVDYTFSLLAPVTVSLTVTQGSATATIANASWNAAYTGQALIFAGYPDDVNRAMSASVGVSLTTITLLRPYEGTSGTATATLYFDTAALPDAYTSVVSLRVADGKPLTPVPSPMHGTGVTADDDYGPVSSTWPTYIGVGEPDRWMVYRFANEAANDGIMNFRLRVWPMPESLTVLEARLALGPQSYSSVDTTPILVPHDYALSILMPIAVKRLSASPFFRPPENLREISDQYVTAVSVLGRMAPQGKRNIRLVAPY